VTEAILNVVAEDPEEQHIAADVSDAAVHEHRHEQGEVNRKRRCFQAWN
jgi:hypothetical protein